MKLFEFLKPKTFNGPERELYITLVRHARTPEFYTELGVPDTPDGRFDLILLHSFFVFRRLKTDHKATADFAQDLFDLMFADMEVNLREMGIGDVGVPKRIKGMSEAFYGRVAAYEEGLSSDDEAALPLALSRNLYRKTEPTDAQVEGMCAYIRREVANMDGQGIDRLLAGEVSFGAPVIA